MKTANNRDTELNTSEGEENGRKDQDTSTQSPSQPARLPHRAGAHSDKHIICATLQRLRPGPVVLFPQPPALLYERSSL